MKRGERLVKFTGGLFLIIGIIAILNQLYIKDFSQVLWFCYIGLIILGIGFLSKNRLLVESQINILAIPLAFWVFDFLMVLFFKESPLRITEYFFQEGHIFSKIITLQHLFTIPLAVYSMKFLKKIKKNSSIFSFIQVSLLFFITRILTTPEQNMNWVYNANFNFNIPYYSVFWFVIVFLMIFLTNLVIKKVDI